MFKNRLIEGEKTIVMLKDFQNTMINDNHNIILKKHARIYSMWYL